MPKKSGVVSYEKKFLYCKVKTAFLGVTVTSDRQPEKKKPKLNMRNGNILPWFKFQVPTPKSKEMNYGCMLLRADGWVDGRVI